MNNPPPLTLRNVSPSTSAGCNQPYRQLLANLKAIFLRIGGLTNSLAKCALTCVDRESWHPTFVSSCPSRKRAMTLEYCLLIPRIGYVFVSPLWRGSECVAGMRMTRLLHIDGTCRALLDSSLNIICCVSSFLFRSLYFHDRNCYRIFYCGIPLLFLDQLLDVVEL